MAMITDLDYALQTIRLSALRHTDDPLTARIISLDPSFALNPYINASGLSDADRWPEIKRALDSPPPDYGYSSAEDGGFDRRRGAGGGGGGLKYTQTIMGPGKTGGMGMRVNGRREAAGKRGVSGKGRANSSSVVTGTPALPLVEKTPTVNSRNGDGGQNYFSFSGRQRADSAPMPMLLGTQADKTLATSMINSGRRMGVGGGGLLESMSVGAGSADEEDEGEQSLLAAGGYAMEDSSTGVWDSSMGLGIADSTRPSSLGLTTGGAAGPLGVEMMDEGSDVDEDELEFEDAEQHDGVEYRQPPRSSLVEDDRRSSLLTNPDEPLDFTALSLPSFTKFQPKASSLTAQLNKHVPHLISTSSAPPTTSITNPFASLYASVSAPSSAASISLQLYFPHSATPGEAIIAKVRKDATVEEVTGFGLFKFWEEQREPALSREESEERWSSIGWGLRIVEDDGEVDEDFPPLDRGSQVSKFSYGQFAIVEATQSQIKQNTAKAPHIQRRPSRIIANPRPSNATRPSLVDKPSQRGRPNISQNPGAAASTSSLSSSEFAPLASVAGGNHIGTAVKGSVGLSSALGRPVLLRVRVTASADVHFTTTISVPSDMYIADLTQVLCKKKRLSLPSTDWVLCLADLTLALPLDRTVASLEQRTDLALVRRQWAVEHGLRIGDRRGGDPSASIFKRISEPAPLSRFGTGVADFVQGYKKYHVQRKIAIGRHERILAIDGDYIHIMPSESRAFFDSMKTTSFHITLVASCKLTGRAGGFKINVWREGGQKRYEFEAENGQLAAEIITTIRQLMKTYQNERNERSSMLYPSRTITARR